MSILGYAPEDVTAMLEAEQFMSHTLRHQYMSAMYQRDQLAEALLLCMNAVRLAGWENDYCMEKANEALGLIQPTTKGEQNA